MSNYRLTYFDVDGGRAEPVRIAMHAAGIAFDDVRLSFPEFLETRGNTRFNSVPVLQLGDTVVTQSNAMARYFGKQAGLYPDDPLQALYCDEALEAVEDLLHYLVPTFGLQGEELETARNKLVDGWLSTYVRGLGELLERGGGEYFADGRLTVADLKVFVLVRWLCSGDLDHVPADLVERLAPNLVPHRDRVAGEPVVTAWNEVRRLSAAR